MKREDCWMTFSESIEEYLSAREEFKQSRREHDRVYHSTRMRQAAEHMDAWTDGAEIL